MGTLALTVVEFVFVEFLLVQLVLPLAINFRSVAARADISRAVTKAAARSCSMLSSLLLLLSLFFVPPPSSFSTVVLDLAVVLPSDEKVRH